MGKFLEVAAERPRGLNWEVMNLATHAGVVKGDATNLPLPYNDNEFFGVYSEHFIEHLYFLVPIINLISVFGSSPPPDIFLKDL